MADIFPFISVVVPVYKVEDYLTRCVESLLGQTYDRMEIILVDDGSPDKCPAMCDAFAEKYERVIALHKPNGGLSDARNYGVAHSTRDWIVFVDSDDYVEPTYVEDLVKLRNQFDADMAVTKTVRENEHGGQAKYPDFAPFAVDGKTAIFELYTGTHVGWAAYGKLYPREVLLRHPFPDGYYEDSACMYLILNEMKKIAIGNYVGNYHYIQREGSILGTSLNPKHYRIFDICDEFKTFIEQNYPDMDILPVLMYKRGVTQLLNLQSMPWKTYCEIFKRYRKLFRQAWPKIMKDSRLSRKAKILYTLICTTPRLFKMQERILKQTR
ncbi:MAG: glycosyltransferase family 2 protein [Clostridia bacterium]|nr:glycosyltransferase family 2 protein [Clostridia bacterium]